MSTALHSLPRFSTLLRLGRVSNLPTVVTNVIAGTVLAGAPVLHTRTLLVILAMSAFYVGGMYLNDAFDREIDARQRQNRPIPTGEISVSTVYAIGFGLLALAIGAMSLYGSVATALAVALAATIVVYDLWHKENALSPVIMSLCRALVYVGAGAAATASIATALIIGALVLAAHIIGLTYAAKQESLNRIDRLWPLAVLALPLLIGVPELATGVLVPLAFLLLLAADVVAVRSLAARSVPGAVPKAVAGLIAAISLVDALAVAIGGGGGVLVALCLAGFVLTRVAQKFIPGT